MKLNVLSSFACMFCLLISSAGFSQEDKTKRPSPPAEAKALIGDANVSIAYSAPSVKGRDLWGHLVPYGKIWRTGANEATVFETDKDITIAGQNVPQGKYALYTIPGPKEWTFVLNSEWNQWGAFKYDQAKDVLRFTAIPEASPVYNEKMRFDIVGNRTVLSWENLRVGFDIN
jgi:hypothetical protein